MKLTFIGADHEVTGSCHFINACGKNLIVDYGMEQGINHFENAPLPVQESLIDYVLLTHAHIDHSGMLPALYAKGFRGQVFTTYATADLCSIMLRDCAHIQAQEAEWRARKVQRGANIPNVEAPYTMEDAEGIIKKIKGVDYGEIIEIAPGLKVRFTDIGHLLGSSSIELWANEAGTEKKLVFSGDIGNNNQPLIKDPTFTKDADYVIMESTYGDRYHSEVKTDYVTELAAVLNSTFAKGGNVVIPSFAVGRTQEILYFLRKIKEDRLVVNNPDFPVYVDSPLAVEATGIFETNKYNCFDNEAMELVNSGIDPLQFNNLHLTITSEESKMINFDTVPKVIISAAGMCDAGRIRHHLKHNLWREECTILFVGYQSVGTLGRSLIDGIEEVKLFGETISVNARIEKLAGMSGHADKKGLLAWINAFEEKPARVFVVHGEAGVCDSFTECLQNEYGFSAYAPYSGTIFDLLNNTLEYAAEPVPVTKKVRRGTEIFRRLLAAGERLLAVIKKNEGLSNKDMARFADQVTSLCDKWDRD